MNPVLALILANAIWGAATPIFKYALTDIPPFILLFLRFSLASAFFLPFIRKYHFENITQKDWLWIALSTVFAFTLHISLLFLGLQKTASINAPIIFSTSPLFLIFLAWLFLKEKIKPKAIIATLVSLSGVLIVVLSPLLASGNIAMGLTGFIGQLEGNSLYFISTGALVISVLFHKKIAKRVPPLVLTYVSFVIASMTFLPGAVMEMQNWNIFHLGLPGIVGIVFGTIFSSAIAYYFYFYGISKIPAQEIGIFTYADPVIAILVAGPLLGEYPNIFYILGAILVFGGIFISEGRLHYHPFHRLRLKYV